MARRMVRESGPRELSQLMFGFERFSSMPGLCGKDFILVTNAGSVEARAQFAEKGCIAAQAFPYMMTNIPDIVVYLVVKDGECRANHRSKGR